MVGGRISQKTRRAQQLLALSCTAGSSKAFSNSQYNCFYPWSKASNCNHLCIEEYAGIPSKSHWENSLIPPLVIPGWNTPWQYGISWYFGVQMAQSNHNVTSLIHHLDLASCFSNFTSAKQPSSVHVLRSAQVTYAPLLRPNRNKGPNLLQLTPIWHYHHPNQVLYNTPTRPNITLKSTRTQHQLLRHHRSSPCSPMEIPTGRAAAFWHILSLLSKSPKKKNRKVNTSKYHNN